MFLTLLYQSFLRQRRRKLLAGLAILLGMTVTTAMISVGVDVGDKMNQEIRSYGEIIVVYEQADTLDVNVGGVQMKPASDGEYLKESDLVKIKSIFWGHNILGYSPMLPVNVKVGGTDAPIEMIGTYFAKAVPLEQETFVTGVTKTHPWWKVAGAWPADDGNRVLVGEKLAAKLGTRTGDNLYIADKETKVAGILTSGDKEDDAIVAPLAMVQRIAGLPNDVSRVYVSALTKPEDEFARRDPASMSPAVLEKWSCSPYANSIAYQIQGAIPGSRAEQVRKVAQNEGVLLSHIAGLMWLVTLAALGAAALAVSASMATTVFERRKEIGLMKSLGANNAAIVTLFVSEGSILAIVGGLLGFGLGLVMAQRMSIAVFNEPLTVQPALLWIILFAALGVTLVGSLASIRRAMRIDSAVVLRGDGV
jgi:putative ABC transport system permease protein